MKVPKKSGFAVKEKRKPLLFYDRANRLLVLCWYSCYVEELAILASPVERNSVYIRRLHGHLLTHVLDPFRKDFTIIVNLCIQELKPVENKCSQKCYNPGKSLSDGAKRIE